METPASAGPVSDPPPPEHQLILRFFSVLDGYHRRPPERALWRDLVHLAIGSTRAFAVPGRDCQIGAAAVWGVAWTIYAHADPAGIVERCPIRTLAAYSRLDGRTVRGALWLLRQWRVVRMVRPSRRRPAVWQMNLGGLDWPAVRERAKRAAGVPSGGVTPPLSEGVTPPLLGSYVSYGESTSAAGASSARARRTSADQRQQQQLERDQIRIEGLFAAIAPRCRELGYDYNERDERRRLREGEIDLDQLQRHADRLLKEVHERRLRRAHGPRYRS